MNQIEDGFLKELRAMFKIEAEEHLKAMSSGFIELEKTKEADQRKTILESVYREAHSLKGAARAVNLNDVETVCQTLEDVLSKLKRQQIKLYPELFDILHDTVDILKVIIDSNKVQDISSIMHQLGRLSEGYSKEDIQADKLENREFPKKEEESDKKGVEEENAGEVKVEKANDQKASDLPASKAEPPVANPKIVEKEEPLISETVRIATEKLDSLLLQAEEMLGAKLAVNQYLSDFDVIFKKFDLWEKEWKKYATEISLIKRSFENGENGNGFKKKNTEFNRLFEFIHMYQDQMKSLENVLNPIQQMADNNSRIIGGMVDNLLEEMKEVLTHPFSTLFKILPKIVRDLSRDQGKEIELIIRGSTIEVDRRILEEMKTPFIHLLRNCIDHGIEKPEERVKKNKPRDGTISISVSQISGNKVEILVTDDGGGIDAEKVKKTAIKKGIISEAEAEKFTEQDALSLIFQSEVSTSPIITDISGRGLGLAIVREKVEKLGGLISLTTEVDQGTTFRIVLPVTMATFRGILVRVAKQIFVVPTANVERVTRFKSDEIRTVKQRETISLDGKVIPLIWLSDVLELPRMENEDESYSFIQVMVLNVSEKRIAFVVDDILNEQEVLVKNLTKQLSRVKNIAGATVLGTGKVVVILNVFDLVKSALKVTTSHKKEEKSKEETLMEKSILIAEDSITSRTLLKNILESAGYRVKATVDGVDAFTALKVDEYDLVVSDVEMPRMNGFDLVLKIRDDKKMADLPVVLVTGLESREHRERGIEVGANAYIVKRSFDQSNLLEVIQKLI
ncbi:hybrid sensor histidine kinase/response regulator [bacterium]|nr:hybrid sensor histidine kinase/response regulator [bacterium]